ncbi:MAG: hypothetical protein PWR06_2215 [Thermoanaerobacteraceae bacterium]|uniref:Uncharacterized protein n=1 Tax=Biomaibacter acetigenes TaxID=2316383 RepID=A0A3G2R4A2_9FIRM|nr:hypothetical protein [Biomaibacter acetigenes]AYO29948.1 hypothetical protein D2962_04430 [Biomaibacter acetigenes]MDK2879499.1 hypothetical protein [Thermoanaerobacteraceae bacterium]MDN5312834.1 hypothetical protein [Thermoanaerobacteraceae bacterium]
MDFRFITADEREALYNEVWAEPVTTVARRYGMSDNGLRKHCKRLGIPLPPSGYWARVKAGQKVSKPALPKVTGELKKHVRNYAIKYRTDLEQLTDAELMTDEELSLLREETKTFIRETCSQIQVKDKLRNPHHLITEHKEEVIYRKKRDKALKQASFSSSYYTSVNSKYRDNKPILPINVSESNMNRAYRILDTIMKTLEDMEAYTQVSIDSGKDTAYFVVMHSAFYFELKEETRKKRGSQNNVEAQTYFVLSMSAKSWFSNSTQYKMEYKDNDDEPLETQIGRIIYDMFVVANKLRAIDELKEREEKRQWEEHERQRRLEQMRKGELEDVRLLEQAASDWDKAEKIRRFADCMERKIAEVANEEKREKLLKWLKWARDKADWLDPLTEKEDELLGKSKHIFDLIEDEDF